MTSYTNSDEERILQKFTGNLFIFKHSLRTKYTDLYLAWRSIKMRAFYASVVITVRSMCFRCWIQSGVSKRGKKNFDVLKYVTCQCVKIISLCSLVNAGFLPKYFSGKISFLRIQVPETNGKRGGPCICAFGSDPYSVIGKFIILSNNHPSSFIL